MQKRPQGRYRGVLSLTPEQRVILQRKRLYGPLTTQEPLAIPLARQLLQSLLADVAPEPTPAPTLSRWIRELLATTWQTYSPTTQSTHRATIASLGALDRPVDQIDTSHVQAWFDALEGSPAKRRNCLGTVRLALAAAGRPVAVRAARVQERPQPFATAQDYGDLLRNARNNPVDWRDELIVGLAFAAGLRGSEIAGLRHEDRDEDGVQIRRAVVTAAGGRWEKGVKEAKWQDAWVPLPEWLLARIGPPRVGYIVGWEPEEPISRRLAYERLKRLAVGTRLAGLPRMGLHTLRRGASMHMLESGADLRTVAEILRNSPEMVSRHYSLSRRDLKRAAIDRRKL